MTWKMARIALVVAFTAILLIGWLLWLRLAPSIAPDGVTLRGKLLPAASIPAAALANGEAWAAEVQVKREAAAADQAKAANKGTDIVYVYLPGFQASRYEIVEDNRPESLRPQNNAEMRKQVLAMLQSMGVAVSESELTEQGFTYAGPQTSYTARVWLKPGPGGGTAAGGGSAGGNVAGSAAAPGPAYAVYLHQERKLGKNVSWTKAVKLSL